MSVGIAVFIWPPDSLIMVQMSSDRWQNDRLNLIITSIFVETPAGVETQAGRFSQFFSETYWVPYFAFMVQRFTAQSAQRFLISTFYMLWSLNASPGEPVFDRCLFFSFLLLIKFCRHQSEKWWCPNSIFH